MKGTVFLFVPKPEALAEAFPVYRIERNGGSPPVSEVFGRDRKEEGDDSFRASDSAGLLFRRAGLTWKGREIVFSLNRLNPSARLHRSFLLSVFSTSAVPPMRVVGLSAFREFSCVWKEAFSYVERRL